MDNSKVIYVGTEQSLSSSLLSSVIPTTVMTSAEKSQLLLIWDATVVRENPSLQSSLSSHSRSIEIEDPEGFKSFESLSQNWKIILEELSEMETPHIVAIGGGALSDGVGTLASLWKRGCSWSIVPTTWLSAIDAAHGGKTALNFMGKNQLGSFHPPQNIFIDTKCMESLPEIEAWHAVGELHKTALLSPSHLNAYWTDLEATKDLDAVALLRKHFQDAIAYKYSVVEKDPFEKEGLRRILNLGHTLGHILEKSESWPHGYAVLRGLSFSLFLSHTQFGEHSDLKKLKDRTDRLIQTHPWKRKPIQTSEEEFLRLLRKDKKSSTQNHSKEWILIGHDLKAHRKSVSNEEALQAFVEWKREES